MNRQALFVGNFLSRVTGGRQVCEDLAVRLPDVDWRVLCASSRPSRLARLIDMAWTAWRNRSSYTVAHVDVFSGRAFVWAEIVCWILRRAGKPYALTLHGGNLPEFARRYPRRVVRLLQSAAAVTAPSHYLREQIRRYCDGILLLPNPIDVASYRFVLRKRPQPHLMWLRAFDTIYNPQLAVEVLALLVQQFPDVRLTMIGPDKGSGSLDATRRKATELGMTDYISLPGGIQKHDVPAAMHQGDIFLNTTNIDNAPVSVLEAMACGLCVVSTNVGGVPYLLQHEHDALLVLPDDPRAMSTAVTRLLTEPGLAERLSHNARRTAEQFDWDGILRRWDSLLTVVAEGSPQ